MRKYDILNTIDYEDKRKLVKLASAKSCKIKNVRCVMRENKF